MKTKVSKYNLLFSRISLLLIGSIFFLSCQKEEVDNKKVFFDYEQIGIEHNAGLNYIFEYLKNGDVNKDSKLKSSSDIFNLTKQATLSFAQISKITKGVDYSKLPLTFQSFNRSTLKSAGTNELVASISSEIDLSSNQKLFLNQLDEVMSNIKKGLQPTIEEIKKLELDIVNQCTNEEAELLLSSTSVARYSLEYWTDNYEKWLTELGGIDIVGANTSQLKSGDWDWFCDTLGNMGKSDVVGAAIGAGAGALAGGVGAAPGAVAGACYSSAGRAIVALLDHWEVW